MHCRGISPGTARPIPRPAGNLGKLYRQATAILTASPTATTASRDPIKLAGDSKIICQVQIPYERSDAVLNVSGLNASISRTLFVSDLDGTLLRPDGSLGDRTVRVVNELISMGGLFTYATARSYTRSSPVTARLDLELPVITYGGAIIVDPGSGTPRAAATLPTRVVDAVQHAAAPEGSLHLILYAIHAGRDRVCWLARRGPGPVERWSNDPRLFPLDEWTQIDPANVFCISVIGEPGALQTFRDGLAADLADCHAVFGEDVYTPGEYWLELTSLKGTKGVALDTVRQEVGADRLVCFGDNHGDLSMFAVADISLAVANAAPEVKQAATDVIGANSDEGVAEWLASFVSGDVVAGSGQPAT